MSSKIKQEILKNNAIALKSILLDLPEGMLHDRIYVPNNYRGFETDKETSVYVQGDNLVILDGKQEAFKLKLSNQPSAVDLPNLLESKCLPEESSLLSQYFVSEFKRHLLTHYRQDMGFKGDVLFENQGWSSDYEPGDYIGKYNELICHNIALLLTYLVSARNRVPKKSRYDITIYNTRIVGTFIGEQLNLQISQTPNASLVIDTFPENVSTEAVYRDINKCLGHTAFELDGTIFASTQFLEILKNGLNFSRYAYNEIKSSPDIMFLRDDKHLTSLRHSYTNPDFTILYELVKTGTEGLPICLLESVMELRECDEQDMAKFCTRLTSIAHFVDVHELSRTFSLYKEGHKPGRFDFRLSFNRSMDIAVLELVSKNMYGEYTFVHFTQEFRKLGDKHFQPYMDVTKELLPMNSPLLTALMFTEETIKEFFGL